MLTKSETILLLIVSIHKRSVCQYLTIILCKIISYYNDLMNHNTEINRSFLFIHFIVVHYYDSFHIKIQLAQSIKSISEGQIFTHDRAMI